MAAQSPLIVPKHFVLNAPFQCLTILFQNSTLLKQQRADNVLKHAKLLRLINACSLLLRKKQKKAVGDGDCVSLSPVQSLRAKKNSNYHQNFEH